MAAEFGVFGAYYRARQVGRNRVKSTHCRDTGAPLSQRQAISADTGWPVR